MEWVIIVIVVIVIASAIIGQTEWWKGVSKAAKILTEYEEKEKSRKTDSREKHAYRNAKEAYIDEFDEIDEIYYRDKNYEYIIDIVSKCGYNRPVKLSQFLQDIDQTQRQSDLYAYLTSKKFRSQYYFFNISEIENEGKPDLILSVNVENLNSNNYDDDNITSDDLDDILLDLSEYSEGDTYIELPIRGINFRNLTDDNVGTFNGYIMPDKKNEHDPNAIGIYGEDGTHFGFVEKGQNYLYSKIENGDGYINGKLEIDTFTDEDTGETRLYGTITIEKEFLI